MGWEGAQKTSPSLLFFVGSARHEWKKEGLRAEGVTHLCISLVVSLSHSSQSLPLLDQVNTMKPKVAQLTILPSTKPGTTKETGNLFKKQIFLSCKRDWC